MSQVSDLGSVLSLTGTDLATTFTASSAIQVGRAERIRFYAKHVRTSGSGATTTTIKVQARYVGGGVTTGYLDLCSNLEDASDTREIEHAHTSTANATTYSQFVLKDAHDIVDLNVSLKVNATGQTTDNTTVYAVASL